MASSVTKLFHKISQIRKDSHGGATVQTALLFGAVALALSVLIAPQLQGAVDTYAENKALGIDRVITGSLKPKKTKQYVIRKSVLDK